MKIQLLSGASTVGASVGLCRVETKDHAVALQCTWTVAPTVFTVDLEGSIDGITWHTLISHAFSAGELTAKKAYFTSIGQPVEFVRANVTTLTGGTAVAIDAFYCAPTRQ